MLEIHDVEDNEIRALAEVQVLSWQAAYRGIIPDAHLDALSIDEGERKWRSLGATETSVATIVATAVDAVVGFASFGPCRDPDLPVGTVGELYAIYVHPQRFSQSIGSSLMAHALRRLRSDGYQRATLWVLERNLSARRFYERWRWYFEGTRKTVRFGDVAVDELRYEHTGLRPSGFSLG